VDTSTGEYLKDLFSTEIWQDHFTTLSDTLGFSLSMYAPSGKSIFVPRGGTLPLCRNFRSSSSEFRSQCDSYCHPIMMKTLQTGKPDVFKCYAGIVSFSLPIDYMNEKTIILGQGSFSSYEDFRQSMNLVNSADLDTISISTPLTFTSLQHAWKVCGVVSDFVNRLMKNAQETVILRKKFESLKSVFSLWSTAAGEPPETRYQGMLYNLSTLLDIDRITIFTLDRLRERYTSLYGLSKSGVETESLNIGVQDRIVKELSSGKPFVRFAPPVIKPGADVPVNKGIQLLFPIMVNRKLAGILGIADRVLNEDDRQIISGFCKQTALFIENHHLHQNLKRKFNRLAAVSELTKTITPIQNHETLLRTILDQSAELLKAEQGSLMLLDQESDDLLLEAKKGVVEGLAEKLRINRGEGIAGRVAELGEAVLVENVEKDVRFKQKNRQHYKTPSFISIPLKIGDRVIGVLNLSDKTSGEVFDDEDLKLIQSFATHAAVVMERNVFYNQSEELKKLSIMDPLTGLLNRRYLYERFKDELARSERHGHNLSLMMLDVDGFKYCNDTFGHLFGDRTLKTIAETLLNTVRSMDVVARFGGDEFMIILPETSMPLAADIAERLRSNVAQQVVLPEDPAQTGPRTLTISIGVVSYPKHGATLELLLENVDKALYRAKNKGKNTIEILA